MGSRGNCVPGSRNSKGRGPERGKVLAYSRSRVGARMECSAGTGQGEGFCGSR